MSDQVNKNENGVYGSVENTGYNTGGYVPLSKRISREVDDRGISIFN